MKVPSRCPSTVQSTCCGPLLPPWWCSDWLQPAAHSHTQLPLNSSGHTRPTGGVVVVVVVVLELLTLQVCDSWWMRLSVLITASLSPSTNCLLVFWLYWIVQWAVNEHWAAAEVHKENVLTSLHLLSPFHLRVSPVCPVSAVIHITESGWIIFRHFWSKNFGFSACNLNLVVLLFRLDKLCEVWELKIKTWFYFWPFKAAQRCTDNGVNG